MHFVRLLLFRDLYALWRFNSGHYREPSNLLYSKITQLFIFLLTYRIFYDIVKINRIQRESGASLCNRTGQKHYQIVDNDQISISLQYICRVSLVLERIMVRDFMCAVDLVSLEPVFSSLGSFCSNCYDFLTALFKTSRQPSCIKMMKHVGFFQKRTTHHPNNLLYLQPYKATITQAASLSAINKSVSTLSVIKFEPRKTNCLTNLECFRIS